MFGCVAQRYEHYVDIVGVTGSIPVTPTNHKIRRCPDFFVIIIQNLLTIVLKMLIKRTHNFNTGVYKCFHYSIYNNS